MLTKPNGSYSSDDLAMLARALEEALAASSDGPAISGPAAEELRLRLGKVIMETFIAGETDPEGLKAIAVESVERQ